MNDAEHALSLTADRFERLLRESEPALLEFAQLVDNGMSPHVTRVLRDLPGCEVTIVVRGLPK